MSLNDPIRQLFATKCSCDECSSAVSPLAYLADLLNFAMKHVKDNDFDAYTLQTLEETFYQPFDTMTYTCEQMNKTICQIRGVVETLRRYTAISGNIETPGGAAHITAGTKEYCFNAYQDLLIQLGTSYDEIRIMQSADVETKTRFLKRLAIGDENSSSRVAQLFLNYNATSPEEVTEENLQKLFGIPDTTSDGTNDGLKLNGNSELVKWNFKGWNWGINTDTDGYIYLDIGSGTTPTVKVSKVSGSFTTTMAEGVKVSTSKQVILEEKNNSGLSGILEFDTDSLTATSTTKISLVPLYQSWLLDFMYNAWFDADFMTAENRYLDPTPAIDPDLISLNDLKIYGGDHGQAAYDLWQARYNELQSERETISDKADVSDDVATLSVTTSEPVAMDVNGDSTLVYVLSKTLSGSVTNYINKIDPNSNPPASSGSGIISSGLSSPEGLLVQTEGSPSADFLYIADSGNNQIKRYSSGGTSSWSFGSATGSLSDIKQKIGTFNNPVDLATDESYNLYIADKGNNRVQSLHMAWKHTTTTGTALSGISAAVTDKYGNLYVVGTSSNKAIKYDKNGEIKATFGTGTSGSADGQLNAPVGVAVDNRGYVYISDAGNDRIQKFKDDGTYITKWGESGTGNLQFDNPAGMIVADGADETKHIYIADSGNNRIQKFDLDGNWISTVFYASGSGQMSSPVDVAVDGDGNIYVADQVNRKVQKYNKDGDWITSWNSYTYDGVSVTVFDVYGITVSEDNRLFISVMEKYTPDPDIPMVVEFDLTGNCKGRWGGTSNPFCNNMQFPFGVRVDRNNNLFVSDQTLNIVVRMRMPYVIGNGGQINISSFSSPSDLAIQPGGYLVVVDDTANRLRQINLNKPIETGNPKTFSGATLSGVAKITSDVAGFIYVTNNSGSSRLVKIDPDMDKVYEWTSSDGLADPRSVITDKNRNLFIGDWDSTDDSIKWIRQLKGLSDAMKYAIGITLEQFQSIVRDEAEGTNVSDQLGTAYLDYPAYEYLKNFVAMADNMANLLDADWEQVYDILVNGWKLKNRIELESDDSNSWKFQEYDASVQVNITPAFFKLLTVDEEASLQLNQWRAGIRQRKIWRRTLKARYQQQNELTEQQQELRNQMDENHLQSLRDVLLLSSRYFPDTDTSADSLDKKADMFSKRLMLDMKNNCCQKVTRVSQAMEVARGLLWGIRNNLLKGTFDLSIDLDSDTFDKQWEWMGSYEKWRSAMFVNLYPENLLLPHLREDGTPLFNNITWDSINNPRFSPQDADMLAQQYANYYSDVSGMVVKCAYKQSNAADTHYFFGVGTTTNTAYWSTVSYKADEGSNNAWQQTVWKVIPGTEGKTKKIFGCDVYRNIKLQRHLYLFMLLTDSNGIEKFGWLRYNLDTLQWDSDCIELDGRGVKGAIGNVKVLNRYAENLSQAPKLLVKAANGATGIFELNTSGTDLNDGQLVYDVMMTPKQHKKKRSLLGKMAYGFFPIDAMIYGAVQNKSLNPIDNFKYAGTYETMEPTLIPLVIEKLYESFHITTIVSKWSAEVLVVKETGYPVLIFSYTALPGSSFKVPLHISQDYEFIGAFQKPGIETTGGAEKATILSYWKGPRGAVWMNTAIVNLRNQFDSSNFTNTCTKISDSGFEGTSSIIKIQQYSQESSGALLHVLCLNNNLLAPYFRILSADGTSRKAPENPEMLLRINNSNFIQRNYNNRSANGAYEPDPPESRAYTNYNVPFSMNGPTYVGNATNSFAQNYNAAFPDVGNLTSTLGQATVKAQVNRYSFQSDFAASSLIQKNYLAELSYFLPMHFALQLQKRGYYKEALDWYRKVYDYTEAEYNRKIYYGLVLEETPNDTTIEASLGWINSPLNPHAVAMHHTNAYTRFTLFSISRCLVEYADSRFTLDNVESNAEARQLYEAAINLLNDPSLTPDESDSCESKLKELDSKDGKLGSQTELMPAWDLIKQMTAKVSEYSKLSTLVAAIKTEMDTIPSTPTSAQVADALQDSYELVTAALGAQQGIKTYETVWSTVQDNMAKGYQIALSEQDGIIHAAATQVVAMAETQYLSSLTAATGISAETFTASLTSGYDVSWLGDRTQPAVELTPNFTEPVSIVTSYALTADKFVPEYLQANNLSNIQPYASAVSNQVVMTDPMFSINSAWGNTAVVSALVPSYVAQYTYCIPPNPVAQQYRMYAEMNLFKMRNCMNIAGIKRELDPYAAPTDTISGLRYIGIGGDIQVLGTPNFNPTQYRYEVLAERAKQLANMAQQMESAMLSALEKKDAESYSLLKARQDVKLSRQTLRLNDLRVKEALSEVVSSELQLDKSELQETHYRELIAKGLTPSETATLVSYGKAATFAKADETGGNFNFIGKGIRFLTGGKLFDTAVAAANATAQLNGQLASNERREQDWKFQQQMAKQDIKIAQQQIRIANQRLQITGQEYRIAEMQGEFAEQTLSFLENKFTNAALYDWMSGVLSNVYKNFLAMATSTARMAQNQLAFERQESTLQFIKEDYWEVPQPPDEQRKSNDRQGLTGSARLLQDIYLLDQYAFEKNVRKNELTKTLSLASLYPVQFQQFRESGELIFDTSMGLFDRDFPGHYMRQIKRVKTTVIGLIPPFEGIKAELTINGTSRIIVKNNLAFQEREMKRLPESISLSGATDATGMFELQPNGQGLLNPFEGNGVDTRWNFSMPKAANHIDYNTIADVLVTLEYTSMEDATYKAKMTKMMNALGDDLGYNNPYSFRNNFADQWYELCSQEDDKADVSVEFTLFKGDFPPNFSELSVRNIAVYFNRSETFKKQTPPANEITVYNLEYKADGENEFIDPGERDLVSKDGLLSSSTGSAIAWSAFDGEVAYGTWKLSFNDTIDFKNGNIEDIIFVVTYDATVPKWPNV
jgi:sugar lactone lactonase YvrE